MSQSSYIAAALLAGFVLFLAARNRLSAYAAVLWGSTAATVPQPQTSPTASLAQSAPGVAADAANAVLGTNPLLAPLEPLLKAFGL